MLSRIASPAAVPAATAAPAQAGRVEGSSEQMVALAVIEEKARRILVICPDLVRIATLKLKDGDGDWWRADRCGRGEDRCGCGSTVHTTVHYNDGEGR